jgi:hypothetical protein
LGLAAPIALIAAMLAVPLAWPEGRSLPILDEAPPGSPQPVMASIGGRASKGAEAAAISTCTGAPMPNPDQVIEGSFGRGRQGSYVMLPFQVPAGTDAVRVKYCHDQPLLSTQNSHTIDMGIYDARSDAADVWDEDEFRGWGGSSRKDVTVSPEGSIDPDPNPVATEETTVGYRPGPIPDGEWAVELGVAAIAEELPTEDGRVAWRVEIDVIDDPAFSDEPYAPIPYDETPAKAEPGWYAGDFHVHARHSNPSDATMRETFDYAFCPDPALGERCSAAGASPGADLDFITLSDYVSDRAWDEIGAFQPDYPGHLIVRSAEVITYRGHVNNHGSATFVDYRTGPVLEASLDGPDSSRSVSSLEEMRPARPASDIFDDIHAVPGGWTQINHPETFPSEVPTFSNLCRGCSWEYSEAETDYSKVDAIEIATGPAGLQDVPTQPGPNPFTTLAIAFYEAAIDAGGTNAQRIAAVGSSDSHKAGRRPDPVTTAPIGQATTVVRAEELSEQGIGDGVRARHTYVKMWGQSGPDLRLEASAPGSADPPAIMGDELAAGAATFTARVLNLNEASAARPGPYELVVVRDGLPLLSVPIPPGEDEFTFQFPGLGEARYGIEVIRPAVGVASIEAYSSPIWLVPQGGGEPPPSDPCDEPLRGTNGDDRFYGTPERDGFHGRAGDDRMRGRRGADCLAGGRGQDRLRGGRGADELDGGPGRDSFSGGRGGDDIDAVTGGRADRRIRCGPGEDRVVTNAGQPVAPSCEHVTYA